MLCLSLDLRGFGAFWGVLAARWRRQGSLARLSTSKGALARRQLSAAVGDRGPKRAWRLLFLASLPRAVATQQLRQRWGHGVSPAPRVRQSAAKPLCTAPGRAELAISSSEVHHRCR